MKRIGLYLKELNEYIYVYIRNSGRVRGEYEMYSEVLFGNNKNFDKGDWGTVTYLLEEAVMEAKNRLNNKYFYLMKITLEDVI